MTRGEVSQAKVHFKGKHDDFLVFVDDVEAYHKWLKDSSIPLAQFVSAFKVFQTHKQGVQGTYDAASKTMLSSEFGTEDEEEAIKILQEGSMQVSEMPSRQGPKNDSKSSMRAK